MRRPSLLLPSFSFFLLLSVAVSIPSSISFASRQRDPRRPPCGLKCRFIFCIDRATVFLTAPGNVSNPEICLLNQEIDQILSTGEALVSLPNGSTTPISKWAPDGLNTPFSPNVFKAGVINGEDNSGIMRTETRGNQNKFLDRRCFILPIKQYESVRFVKGAKRVVPFNVTNRERGCVAFVPRVWDILIEVQWLSGDDLDLSVEEPDGAMVDFRKRKTECGNLLIDANVDTCDIRQEGIERVFYNRGCPKLQSGLYTVRLRHATNCLLGSSPKPTTFEIRIVINGFVNQRVRGSSNKNEGALITSFTFRI